MCARLFSEWMAVKTHPRQFKFWSIYSSSCRKQNKSKKKISLRSVNCECAGYHTGIICITWQRLCNLTDTLLRGMKLLKQVEQGGGSLAERGYCSAGHNRSLHLQDSFVNCNMTTHDGWCTEACGEMYGIWLSCSWERGRGAAAADWSLFTPLQLTCTKS